MSVIASSACSKATVPPAATPVRRAAWPKIKVKRVANVGKRALNTANSGNNAKKAEKKFCGTKIINYLCTRKTKDKPKVKENWCLG